MKGLLSIQSEKQWTPFYVDLDPCESVIWPLFDLFESDITP